MDRIKDRPNWIRSNELFAKERMPALKAVGAAP